jgi:3-oxoacyl-[acyl-carrier-protein] synthase III
MARYAHITGWGMAVPERVLTNHDLAQMVDTSDEWIRSRTGIGERHIASPNQSTATLAVDAAIKALTVAKLAPDQVDLIIVASATPEHIFPATACLVQDQIGAIKAGAFDLSAACSGFLYALNMATQAIRSGSLDNVLVIGAETLSKFTDWQDRNTCVLFGDGAGAFVLQSSDQPGGILSAVLRSDGSGGDLLMIPAGGSHLPASSETVENRQHFIQMNGREVFRFATRVMAKATREAVEAAQLTMDDIKYIIPHQANQRIIDNAASQLEIPLERCIINLERYGNTSTASIPMAICEAVADGRIQLGDHMVMVAFGAGLTWASLVVQWSGPFPTKRIVYPAWYRTWARIVSPLRRLRRRLEGFFWRIDGDSLN